MSITGFGPSLMSAIRMRSVLLLPKGSGNGPGRGGSGGRDCRCCPSAHALHGFEGVDVIGFHGQTLAHAPRLQGTLQVGDGAALARALNTPVVWDFRSADVQMGGEGAPLAPFFHHACARYIKADAPLAFSEPGRSGQHHLG